LTKSLFGETTFYIKVEKNKLSLKGLTFGAEILLLSVYSKIDKNINNNKNGFP
jgi:hypothetical protein